MQTIRIKIADLFAFDDKPPSVQSSDVTSVIPWILKHLGFLPQPLAVTIDGDEVVLQFPEESDVAQNEAARLAEKGAKRAAEGNYSKAIGIFKRVLELQPSLHRARRDLAMAYMEIGDVENATNHLMEVLLLDSGDAWSWVVPPGAIA
jgi:tetratricopeptide (TPR) repeat protein